MARIYWANTPLNSLPSGNFGLSDLSDIQLLALNSDLSLPSTARFNPEDLPLCLASPALGVFIPILLNNTKVPSMIQYTVAPLADRAPRHQINVTSRDIKRMQSDASALIAEREKFLGLTSSFDADIDDDDEWDEYDDTALSEKKLQLALKDSMDIQRVLPSSTALSRSTLTLEKTQQLVYLRVTRPGLIRLERLLDQSGAPVRVFRPTRGDEVKVVECPSVKFEGDDFAQKQCVGTTKELSIEVRGTAPISLSWHHEFGARGKRENFVVDGIKGSAEVWPSLSIIAYCLFITQLQFS